MPRFTKNEETGKMERVWTHNNNTFKAVLMETKEVEILPGYNVAYEHIIYYIVIDGQDKLRYQQWEAVNPDTNAINEAMQRHIMGQIASTECRIGASSGCVPLCFYV